MDRLQAQQVYWQKELILLMVLSFGYAFIDLPAEVDRPPVITKQPEDIVYAVQGFTLELPCEADANPDVGYSGGYTWFKDGKPFDVVIGNQNTTSVANVTMSDTVGTIEFRKTMTQAQLKQFEGVYQCFASNKLGTAMTETVRMKVATKPNIPRSDATIDVKEGASVSFFCNYNVSDGIARKWNINRNLDLPSERITELVDGRGLVFSNVIADSDDGLVLFCVVKNLAKREYADETHYKIEVDRDSPIHASSPEIISPSKDPENRIFLRGNDIILTCAAAGIPTPAVRWEKVSGDFPEGRTFISNFGKTMEIRNSEMTDQGNYRCVANNSRGVTQKVVAVVVHAKPYFLDKTHRPQNVIKVPGDEVTIKCQPQGIPKPEVEWRVNGKPLSDFPMKNQIVHLAQRIKIYNLTVNNTAVFQCISRNQHGTVITQGYLSVSTWKPISVNSKPDLMHQQVEGNHVEMKCRYFGLPQPNITWMKNRHRVAADNRFYLLNGKSLKILKLKKSDGGVYSCIAQNAYGVSSTNFSLNVLNKTRLVPEGGRRHFVARGASIELKVKVMNDSQMTGNSTAVWKKDDDDDIGRGLSVVISNATLEDTGTYHLSVKTPLDHAEVSMHLFVVDYPLPPNELIFQKNDPWNLTISWSPGYHSNSSITDYKIESEDNYRKPSKWQVLKDSIEANTDSITAVLSPGGNYRFRIWSRNAAGWSKKPRLNAKRYLTPPKPGTFSIKTSSTTANLTWSPPKVLLPDTSIYMEYQSQSNKENGLWMRSAVYKAVPKGVSFTVDDLQPQTSYSYRVVSVHAYGNSTTKIYVVQTASSPGRSTSNVTSEIWFIVVMCVAGLLVLIFLIICYARRRKGGKYAVAEKEHHFVESQPVKNKDSGDYKKVEDTEEAKKPLTVEDGTNTDRDAKPSGPQRTRGDSVEGDSIEDFVGTDPKEFNEDGSFIGQYGAVRSPSSHATPSTPPEEANFEQEVHAV